MAAELIPIAETPLAAGLPEFVNVTEIGVNEALLGVAGTTACMGKVTLDWYRGETVQPEAYIGGFAGNATAFAVGGGKTAEPPRGKYELGPELQNEPRVVVCGHYPRDARIFVDVPSVQDKLSKAGTLQSTNHWAAALNETASQQFRAASREVLLKSRSARLEGAAGVTIASTITAIDAGFELALSTGTVDTIHFLTTIYMGTLIGHTVAKLGGELAFSRLQGPERSSFKEFCFSLIPGYHLDRYLGVEALTRARRIIRPMPAK